MKTRIEGDYIAAFPEGRITYDNAGLTEQELRKIIEDNPGKELTIDAQDLEYVSSAGLSVLSSLRAARKESLPSGMRVPSCTRYSI